MTPEAGSDWNIRLFDLTHKQRRPAITSVGYWRISKAMKPYIVAKFDLEGKTYKLLLYPRSEDSFPAVGLFERTLRREALLMASALGGPEVDEAPDSDTVGNT